jgi:hypothetical protein
MELSIGIGMSFDPALQKYCCEEYAGTEPSLLVQETEMKLVMATDPMNELQEESS